ncbi:MAG: SKIP/SNW domain-containing protein [Piptocephalis tieghemiana]|nr:MAG: SKIP/SNW domain-containing protein [Piptocephalis tieghemiana]
MASLSSLLPKPTHSSRAEEPSEPNASTITTTSSSSSSSSSLVRSSSIPPYGKRRGWLPRDEQDFGDGGAYPECHVTQYPLGLGRRGGTRKSSSNAVALRVGKSGEVEYDALARQGHRAGRVVHSKYQDVVPLRHRADLTEGGEEVVGLRPGQEEVRETAERTQRALDKLVGDRSRATRPTSLPTSTNQRNAEASFIRYTPAKVVDGASSSSSSGEQKVIKVVEMPVDPLEPPKFRHKRVPAPPPSPPAPVLHSPSRKVSAQEQEDWVIPPCISNWKNAKGYTIPLDKRLAADGRGLQEVTVSDGFARLAEALGAADRHAREEVKERSKMQQRVAEKAKSAQEEHLRRLAQQAREHRSGVLDADRLDEKEEEEEEEVDEQGYRERQELRRERERERERELRMSRMGQETKAKYLAREEGRDVSERIALGLAKPTQGGGEGMYDSRLYNRSQGLDSGFRGEDGYDVYDRELFAGVTSSSVYRPGHSRGRGIGGGGEGEIDTELYGGGKEEEIERMMGVGKEGKGGGGPVAFTKDTGGAGGRRGREDEAEEDPFGIDEFIGEARRGAKRVKGDEEARRERG